MPPRRREPKCCGHRGQRCPKDFPTIHCHYCANLHCAPVEGPSQDDPWAEPTETRTA